MRSMSNFYFSIVLQNRQLNETAFNAEIESRMEKNTNIIRFFITFYNLSYKHPVIRRDILKYWTKAEQIFYFSFDSGGSKELFPHPAVYYLQAFKSSRLKDNQQKIENYLVSGTPRTHPLGKKTKVVVVNSEKT